MREHALELLKTALDSPTVNFRQGQLESIEGLLDRKRMLVVERTGWGKSMVYFIATKLLREKGAGPTLVISPLLSLMRNQIEAAERIGVNARTINSVNKEDWDTVERELGEDNVDILLISPERLGAEDFQNQILPVIADRIGLFAVDEAHCISDWGHDFRPDYKRIVRVLQAFPPNVPVLATTATANDRVVKDVISQLGDEIIPIRGSLVRESLRLQNITMLSPAARLAWLAKTIPTLPGSGIIYTLTQRDSEQVAKWLRANDINAKAYHAGLDSKDDAPTREQLEQHLLKDELKVLVATIALGMGFDKPDLGFVIHFQRPASVVHYYQQVGRAGRAIENAYGILLCGEEDDHIADFFIRNAFPPQKHVSSILNALDASDNGLSIPAMQSKLNLKKSQIEKTIKFLNVESPSPITKIGSKWNVTAVASSYEINEEYIRSICEIRRQEQTQMQEYMLHDGCLMKFLENALDDPSPAPCSKCVNCDHSRLLPTGIDDDLANQAALFLRRSHQKIEPRRQWPPYKAMPAYGFTGRISEDLIAEIGRALCLWRDAGWGQLVAKGKYEDGRFADELVGACVEMIKQWNPSPAPEWVTCIPSRNHPELVPDFAERFADKMSIPFVPCVEKIEDNQQQKEMENSFQQAKNLDGVFRINLGSKAYSPCILVDDIVDSRWTFTVVSALLRQAGCMTVFPLALALNNPRMD